MDRPEIIETNVNTRQLFAIHIIDDGSYAAIREVEPLFCFVGSTIMRVTQLAEDALASHKKWMVEDPPEE